MLLRQSERIRFAVFVAFLAACFLFGGASRLDVMSLIVLQPFAALCAAAFLILPGPVDWRAIRIPLVLLAALAGLHLAQLIPLPPEMWAGLPGHAPLVKTLEVAGVMPGWRPISLTPDLTLASLVGLFVPLAAILGAGSLSSKQRQALLPILIAGIAASAVVALFQIAGGRHSVFYFYRVTNEGAAVGLFANRNHQALLLALAWPMLAIVAASTRGDVKRRMALRMAIAGLVVFLIPMLLVTGSRAGLALGLAALASAALMWRLVRSRSDEPTTRLERLLLPSIAGIGALVLIATIWLARDEATQRLLSLGAETDTRVEVTPVLVSMVRAFFPVGAGLGSFDPVYRMYEPVELIDIRYLNHAHNDLLELVITAGLPGLALLTVFLGWAAYRTIKAWRSDVDGEGVVLARLGSVMIVLILASSLVDYPLRTPLMMVVFACACVWLCPAAPLRERSSQAKRLYA